MMTWTWAKYICSHWIYLHASLEKETDHSLSTYLVHNLKAMSRYTRAELLHISNSTFHLSNFQNSTVGQRTQTEYSVLLTWSTCTSVVERRPHRTDHFFQKQMFHAFALIAMHVPSRNSRKPAVPGINRHRFLCAFWVVRMAWKN